MQGQASNKTAELSPIRPRFRQAAPMAPVAAAMMLGIVAGRYVPPASGPGDMGLYVVFGSLAMIVAIVTCLREHLRPIATGALMAAIFAAGAVHVRLAYFQATCDDVVTFTGASRIPSTLRGQIVTWPQVIESDANQAGYRRPPRTCFVLRCREILTSDGWRSVGGLSRVTVKEPDRRLQAGQDVELVGYLGRMEGPDNPGQYDAAAVGRNQHTLTWFSAEDAQAVTIDPGGAGANWLQRFWWQARAFARQHWAGLGAEQDAHLLNALIIGERHPALQTLSRVMMQAGIVHFVCIAGLHLGIFLGFIYLLCRLAAMTPRRSAAAALMVLAVYIALAQANSPLLRSAIMAAALCLATIFRRSHSGVNALAVAAVIVLAMDPLELFSAGFQLSFGLVGAMLLYTRRMKEFLFGRWIRRRGLVVYRGQARATRWIAHAAADWLMTAVSFNLVAYLLAIPLVAYHFGLFSPYAGFLSIPLLPLVAAVLVPGYVSLALAWPMPNLSHTMGALAAKLADCLAAVISALKYLPGLSFELRPVSVWWVLLYYLAAGAVIYRRRLPWGTAMAAACVAALAGATVWTQLPAPAPATAELHVLAVGAGQCIVLRTPSGKTFILDAGTRSDMEVSQQVLEPFLRHCRFPDPSFACASHADTDHFGGLAGLVQQGRLKRLYLNEFFGLGTNGAEGSPPVKFLDLCRQNGVEVVRIAAGTTIQLDERTRLEVLWPPPGRRDLDSPAHVNDTSLVLRITCGNHRVIVPGDLAKIGEGELAAMGPAMRADVLVMPHHGGWTDSLPKFFQAVSPKVAVASNNMEPRVPARGGEASRQFYARLRSACRFYSTPHNGWVCVHFGGSKIEVETMR